MLSPCCLGFQGDIVPSGFPSAILCASLVYFTLPRTSLPFHSPYFDSLNTIVCTVQRPTAQTAILDLIFKKFYF